MDTYKLIDAKTNASNEKSNATKNEKSSMTNEKNVAENNSDRLLDVLHIDTDKRNNTTQVARRGRPKKDISGNSAGKKSENNKPGRPRKDTLRRIKHSQDLIKKGFNVCYALEEFIRATQQNTCG